MGQAGLDVVGKAGGVVGGGLGEKKVSCRVAGEDLCIREMIP